MLTFVQLARRYPVASTLNPYISFNGDARQAIEFYASVLGGEPDLRTFGEYGMAGTPQENQIMHGQLETPKGYTLMASDTPPGMDYSPGTNITVSLSGDDVDDLRGYFAALSEGGTVTVPLEKQMWGDEFGALTDKFGINWMVNITTG